MPDLSVLFLYADDTSVVVTSDEAIVALFETYDLFEKASGAKINLDKCEGLWLGSWRHRLDAPVAIRWNCIKIKVLGVFIGPGDLEEAICALGSMPLKTAPLHGVRVLSRIRGRPW